MGNALRAGLVVAIGALALAGCGVAGPLEPPGGVAANEGKPVPATPKRHEPFILDGILQ